MGIIALIAAACGGVERVAPNALSGVVDKPSALRATRPTPAAGTAAVVILVALGILTWRQCRMYRDAETLYRATIAGNPEC
jgi:hypothetical protein